MVKPQGISVKRAISIGLLFALLFMAITVSVQLIVSAKKHRVDAVFDSLTKQSSNVYLISSVSDFEVFRDGVNAGNKASGITFKLTCNLDFNNKELTPITEIFSGTFDGGFYEISNFKIINGYSYWAGTWHSMAMFCRVSGATIKNLTLNGFVGRGSSDQYKHVTTFLGGFAGFAENSTFIYCCNKSTVERGLAVGGIVGRIDSGSISYCGNHSSIKSYYKDDINSDTFCGGIAGLARIQISNCYNRGNIEYISNSSGYYETRRTRKMYYGGIAGSCDKTIDNCYNTGVIAKSYFQTASEIVSKDKTEGILLWKETYTYEAIAQLYIPTYSNINGNLGDKSTVAPTTTSCYGTQSAPVAYQYATLYFHTDPQPSGSTGVGEGWLELTGNKSTNVDISYWKWYSRFSFDNNAKNITISIYSDKKYTDKLASDTYNISYVYKTNYTAITTSNLKSGSSGLDATVWAVDSKINNGYPYFKARYWKDNSVTPNTN